MQNLVLKSVHDTNPFRQFPQLKTIWSPELAALAEDSVDDAFDYLADVPHGDIGEIFLIYVDAVDEKNLIGVSGYFPNPDNNDEIMLRWHGLLKNVQKRGYSEQIIDFIKSHVENRYPDAKRLTEYMPVIESYEQTQQYFERLGFKRVGEPEKVDWSEHEWQSYAIELNKVKNKLSYK